MELQILFSSSEAKYLAIYNQIKQKILSQVLPPHVILPAKRALAEQLNVSIHTVQTAYEQLLSEGYIYAVERKGYFVSEIDLPWRQEKTDKDYTDIKTNITALINFRNGQVDANEFPFKIWNKLIKEKIGAIIMSSAAWQGEPSLRNQIAQYLRKAKGIECQANQVFIFSGTQHQLQELFLFFKKPSVGIEHPCFHRAYHISKQLNLHTELVKTDAEGCTIPTKSLKLLYTTPAHQFPLGMIMPIARRIKLLEWAKQTDSYIIEDDYDSEFRYKGSPIPPLAQLDNAGRVIYFGTFSKTLIPSLRISYMVLPFHLVNLFEQFYQYQKSTVSRLDQLVLAGFMKEGYYERHIAKMRNLYREKRQHLMEKIDVYLGKDFQINGDDAGLHIVLTLPAHLNEQLAIQKAESVDIAVDPISLFYQKQAPNNKILLGYGAPSKEEMEKGIRLLATVWKNNI